MEFAGVKTAVKTLNVLDRDAGALLRDCCDDLNKISYESINGNYKKNYLLRRLDFRRFEHPHH